MKTARVVILKTCWTSLVLWDYQRIYLRRRKSGEKRLCKNGQRKCRASIMEHRMNL
jgi:hypothetical protein